MNPEEERTPAPVQLRIGFTPPQRSVSMELRLSGLTVVVDSDDLGLAASHLAATGIYTTLDETRGLLFPVRELMRLRELPKQAAVAGSGVMEILLILIVAPPAAETPVTVNSLADGDVIVAWTDGVLRHEATTSADVVPAMAAMSVPFVATAETWQEVLGSGVQSTVARAHVNLDRFIEISASQPQRVESSPLPGLWRIDGTHYGLPLAYAPYLSRTPGFTWDSGLPVLERPPTDLSEPGFPLSEHAKNDLRDLVNGLASDRARAVVWSPGLGRRVFCLAALQSLDAFPVLIVCAPWAVWSWQRNLELLNRDGDDAQIVTYDALGEWQGSAPASVVFDDLDHFSASDGPIGRALHRFDAVLDLYRVAVSSTLPSAPNELASYMSLLRPAEFDPTVPVALRYPGDPLRRLREHAHPYVSARTTALPGESDRFRRCSVEVLEPSDQLRDALTGSDPKSHREIVTVGTAAHFSPKIGRALELVRTSTQRRIAVVSSSDRALTLLSALLRPRSVAMLDIDDEVTDGTWMVSTKSVPLSAYDLRPMDMVVVLDWPDSLEDLDTAIGGPDEGPSRVTVLHLSGPEDAKLAIRASRGSAPSA